MNKKIIIVIITLLCYSVFIIGQVGINKDNPDPSAILHIDADNKGVLFPDISDTSKLGLKKDGLMFYNTTSKTLNYYESSAWVPVTPPKGSIIMWYGDITQNFTPSGLGKGLMTGWALCNGSNGTPNLNNMFVRGSDQKNQNGVEGGANSQTISLTTNELPTHNHPLAITGGSHIHDVTISGGDHAHVTRGYPNKADKGSEEMKMMDYGSDRYEFTTKTDGAHTHTGTINNSGDLTINGSIDNTGSGNAFVVNTVPKYISLAYIMRLK